MGIFKRNTKGDKAVKKADKKSVAAKKATPEKKADKKETKAATAKKEAPKKLTKSVQRKDTSDVYSVLVSPIVTEKAERLQANGKYLFNVSRSANKVEVARAIKEVYGVTPVAVNIVVRKGKAVRFGKYQGRRKTEKKAIVTLKKGEILTVTAV